MLRLYHERDGSIYEMSKSVVARWYKDVEKESDGHSLRAKSMGDRVYRLSEVSPPSHQPTQTHQLCTHTNTTFPPSQLTKDAQEQLELEGVKVYADILGAEPAWAPVGFGPLLHANCSYARDIAGMLRAALLRKAGDEAALTEAVGRIIDDAQAMHGGGWNAEKVKGWRSAPKGFLDHLEFIISTKSDRLYQR